MRKFLILSLVLLIGFSSLFLFPRVVDAGWSAPVGPYASDPSKPYLKDTISMTGVFSSPISEVSTRKELVNCHNYIDNDSEWTSPCFQSSEICSFIFDGMEYARQCKHYRQFPDTRNISIYIIKSSEKVTITTINKTIQIKWKNSQSVERIDTISEKKEIYYYNCSNVDCITYGVYYNDSYNPNIRTLTNYTYEPFPARSFIFTFKLNSKILAIGGPECSYQYGSYQNIVDCATFGLSADGRTGDARYHNSVSMDDNWWDNLANSLTLGILSDLIGINAVGSPSSVSTVTNYGTVENSNNLGVGGWTWSGFYGNTNTGFIIPPPVVDLRTSSQFEIFKPNNLASVNLNWNSSYADSCSASGGWSGSKPLGEPTADFETLKKPRGNYSFTLSCQNKVGSISDTVTTQVIQVPHCGFSSNPASIILPQTSTLSWSCDYADSCSIDQGVGSVCSSQADCSDDNVKVRPTETTTFTLTCQGLDGQRQWQTTVSVGGPGEIKYKEIIPQ